MVALHASCVEDVGPGHMAIATLPVGRAVRHD
jgi:hypothetical protein